MGFGYALARCVYCAARLGIADLLRDGPKSAADLAAATHTHRDALYRTLRALASAGVFEETEPGVFILTPLAEPLCADAADSIRAMILFLGDHMHAKVYAEMPYSVETGNRAFDHVFGEPPFEYLAKHPEDARVFHEAMTSHSGAQNAAICEAYDFTQFQSVADVGGGHGHLLAAILKTAPGTRGILFDLPGVIEQAKAKGMLPAERCDFIAGSFFDQAPTADACIMKHIIHDWDDEAALRILGACRRSIRPGGKLLLAEMILPRMNEPGFAKLLDIEMLLIPGGRERTVDEYAALLGAVGFRLTRVVPTKSSVAIVEAA